MMMISQAGWGKKIWGLL